MWELIRLANRHPRVNILQPGPGVGAQCIAVDLWFIVHGAHDEAKIIRTAREFNDSKMHHVLERATELVEAHTEAPVAFLGPALQGSMDDFRESAARYVTASLARKFGERVRIVEPYARELPREFESAGATLVDIDTALETCGLLVVLVIHDVYRVVPPEERGRGCLRHAWDLAGRLAVVSASAAQADELIVKFEAFGSGRDSLLAGNLTGTLFFGTAHGAGCTSLLRPAPSGT